MKNHWIKTFSLILILLMTSISFAQRRPGGLPNNQGGPNNAVYRQVANLIAQANRAKATADTYYRNPGRDKRYDNFFIEGTKKLSKANRLRRSNTNEATILAIAAKNKFTRYASIMDRQPAGTHSAAVLKVAEAHKLRLAADKVRQTSQKYQKVLRFAMKHYNSAMNYLNRGGDLNDKQAVRNADKAIRLFKLYLRKNGYRNL